MIPKAWHSIEELPYCFSRSSIKFQGHMGWKIDDLNPNLRLLGRSQLSNPSDLSCLWATVWRPVIFPVSVSWRQPRRIDGPMTFQHSIITYKIQFCINQVKNHQEQYKSEDKRRFSNFLELLVRWRQMMLQNSASIGCPDNELKL